MSALEAKSNLDAYAHTLPGFGPSAWEPLEHHLEAVAKQARDFASSFGAAEWGEWLGRWHDLGKYSGEFQEYIRRTSDPDAAEEQAPVTGRVDHSTFGARHASKVCSGLAGQLLAFCIAGHHAGLADATANDEDHQRGTLAHRLDESRCSIPRVNLAEISRLSPTLQFPFAPPTNHEDLGFFISFFTRMIFSALIDADRGATEEFCDRSMALERNRAKPTLSDLREALDGHLRILQSNAPRTSINTIRARVLRDCIDKAALAPGFFSLNVPTGGGKTFASLAFALHHAKQHTQFRRVVVAIPFTSIIEQTADVYRKALGPLAELGLVEHHSNIDPVHNTRANQLAAENWDAPLVVTTNVQLFESLFAAKTTPCRKLHRLAGSIIILDEAQMMPVDLLCPTLGVLRELVARYRCTIILCTATQPSLEHRPREFEIGLTNVHPITDDISALHAELKRVEVHHLGLLTDDQLADRVAGEKSVLCVVNTRPHAAKLFDALVRQLGSAEGVYHLSTLMCAQHRRDVLTVIRTRLKDKKPCRLVSTQLIEAGVDVDFPVVYRAPAGYDAAAQAAGRCNREGKLEREGKPVFGQLFLFDTESPPPPGMLRQAAQTARELYEQYPDPLTPAAIEAYFRLFYWSRQHEWDKHGVMSAFGYSLGGRLPPLMFRQGAAAYQIIREKQIPVVVPYGDSGQRMRDFLLSGEQADYRFLRSAQRFIVSIREPFRAKLADQQVIVEHESGLWAWANDTGYSSEKGMVLEAMGFDPQMLIH